MLNTYERRRTVHQEGCRDRGRRAFTLVELLVAITILIVLASIMLYGMAGMQNLAKIQRTKSQIAYIHEVIMEKMESFETMRPGALKVNQTYKNRFLDPGSGIRNQQAAYRVDALRELIRLELPDRLSDLIRFRVIPGSESGSYKIAKADGKALPTVPVVLAYYPASTRAYCARFVPPPEDDRLFQNESAECLYLILSRLEVRGESALKFFTESEIGDTDGDGNPEILDAWGTPIRFIRWPVGFVGGLNDLQQPDPTDMTGVYVGSRYDDPTWDPRARPHYVVPLIVSAGPDRLLGMSFANQQREPIFYATRRPFNSPFGPAERPYGGFPELAGLLTDEVDGESARNAVDNIHNHGLSTSIR